MLDYKARGQSQQLQQFMPHHEDLTTDEIKVFHHFDCDCGELVAGESSYKTSNLLRFGAL